MTAQTEAARRLYDAFAARDPQAILDSLQPDFVGEVSSGMPLDVGGRHEGAEAMLRDVWAQVFGRYEMSVEAEELLCAEDGRVVAIGHYRGSDRETGFQVEAAFAHVLEFEGDRISSLRQITDTASWSGGSGDATGEAAGD